jgi:signal transduction histidine kinase
MPLPRIRIGAPAWLRLPQRTARFRLTSLYGGVFLLSGAALVAVTYVLFRRATQYRRPHLPTIPHTPAIQDLLLPTPLAQAQQHLAQAQYQLAQAKPQLLLAPGPPPAQARDQITQAQERLMQVQHQLAQAVHQVAQAGSVQAAQRAADSHQLLVNSGIALAVVALLALLAGWLVAGRILRPIRTITSTARRISSTSLHERLALHGPQDELKELGDTLDDLFGRLHAAFEAQRHFVANASHELRTPLTAERTMLQVALDDPHTSAETWRSTAKELLASSDEQQHLIEALLTLASSESALDHRERTDLADACQMVLARSGAGAARHGLLIETAIDSAPLEGDPTLIERLVANLVDNAIAHNVVNGRIYVSAGPSSGKAVLSVANTGPVIPPSEVRRLFQPFQRLDPSRTHLKNGHGLGLSIVQAIATTHHAAITADPLPEGGLSVTITFPPLTRPGTSPDETSRDRTLAGSPP